MNIAPECRPGGLCECCNPPPVYCDVCGDEQVENPGDLCPGCEADVEEEDES